MQIEVDEGLCIGAGRCVFTAEDLFDQNEDSLAYALVSEVPEDRQQAAREAAEVCPTMAISLVES